MDTNLKRWAKQIALIAGADEHNVAPLAEMDLQSQVDYLKEVHRVKGGTLPNNFHKRPVYPNWCDWCIRLNTIVELSRDENGKMLHLEELTLEQGFNRIEEYGKIAHKQGAGNVLPEVLN